MRTDLLLTTVISTRFVVVILLFLFPCKAIALWTSTPLVYLTRNRHMLPFCSVFPPPSFPFYHSSFISCLLHGITFCFCHFLCSPPRKHDPLTNCWFNVQPAIHVSCCYVFLSVIPRGIYYYSHGARMDFNPLTTKIFNLNFHPIEVVSR